MSFLENAANKMNKKMESIERYKNRYESYDDKELIEKYKRSSGDAKIACAQLLNERGYRKQ